MHISRHNIFLLLVTFPLWGDGIPTPDNYPFYIFILYIIPSCLYKDIPSRASYSLYKVLGKLPAPQWIKVVSHTSSSHTWPATAHPLLKSVSLFLFTVSATFLWDLVIQWWKIFSTNTNVAHDQFNYFSLYLPIRVYIYYITIPGWNHTYFFHFINFYTY